MKKVNGENTIDLMRLLIALLKWIWAIVIVTVGCAILGFAGTKAFVAPTYSSGFTAYVNNHNTTEMLTYVNQSDMYARSTLATTAASIARSITVREQVANAMGFEDYKEVQVSTGVDTNSAILSVRVITKGKDNVKACAEILADVLKTETERIIEGSSFQVVDVPRDPEGRYAPSYTGNAMKAALLGLVLTCAVIIILALRDDTIRNISDLEDNYEDIPLIGEIPNLNHRSSKGGYYGGDGYGYGYGYGGTQRNINKTKK